MSRGQTRRRRPRASLFEAVCSSRPLIKTHDNGKLASIRARDVGATGNHWIESFLKANLHALRRLDLSYEVVTYPELQVVLRTGAKIGAIPLLNPATQRVAAGFLVEPRFRWAGLGAVFSAIGYSVEPSLGGSPLVPGSTREVPPWILAGPVLTRIAALISHMRRGFVDRSELRSSPRGRIDWTKWTVQNLPRGAWTSFPCHFTEPDCDPELIAAIRWTLLRLNEELSSIALSPTARHLLSLTSELQSILGPGPIHRPTAFLGQPSTNEWIASAIEAMTWVAEERGVGGARILDGLAWDLSIDAVWEAWVASFSAELAGRLGMVASPFQLAKRSLHWHGPIQSMAMLIPDVELRSTDHVVWIDAKYKRHLKLLAYHGWSGLGDEIRNEHRADLHQALAYASLADAPQTDTLLVYPREPDDDFSHSTVATVTSGRRQVKLILASIPFGFRNSEQHERCLTEFRELLLA